MLRLKMGLPLRGELMRLCLLFTLVILLSIGLPLLPLGQSQKPEEVKLPVPQDFPEAGENCKRRVNMSPWIGMPGVDWPNTFQCVLQIHTCEGVKQYKSGVRNAGATMCADYSRTLAAFVNREICCDKNRCEPDAGKLCEAIGRATRLVKEARIPAASAQLYDSLKQNLGPVLERIKQELCDDTAAQAKVDELLNKLNSLNYVSGQSNLQNNLTLLRLEDGLRELAVSECDVSPASVPPKPQPCKYGEKKVTADEELASKPFTDGLQTAIDELKNTARELEGTGRPAAQQIEEIKGKIAHYEKIKGFWQNIKAGACIPGDVLQAINEVARDRKASNYSDNCPSLCSAFRSWFLQFNPSPQVDLQGRLLYDRCMADCN
jgi:hypothetical protein